MKVQTMKKYINVALFLLLYSFAYAQSSIIGQVVSKIENEPISDVNISVLNYNLGSSTDSEGFFQIDLPKNLTDLTIELSAIGYSTISKKFNQTEMRNGLLFEMESKIIEMNPIVVIQNLSRINNPFLRSPGSTDLITNIDVKKFNDTDINRILGKIPGIYIQEEDGFGLRPNIGMRGTGVERSSKINIMEDGVPISPAPYASPAAYYSPTAGRMYAFEARKGSSQIKYGPHSTGGALNYVSTPIPNRFKSNINANTGNYDSYTVNANVGTSHSKIGYLFEFLHDQNNGFKKIDFNSNSTGFKKTDFMGKFRYSTELMNRFPGAIELKLSSTNEISNETYLGLTQKDYEQNPYRRYSASQNDQMNADHTQITLTSTLKFSEKSNISFVAYRNDFKRNWYKLSKVNGSSIGSLLSSGNSHENYKFLSLLDTPDDIYQIKANNREYFSEGIQLVSNIKSKLFFENNLMIGLRFHQDEMDRFQKVDKYGMEKGALKISTKGTWGVGSKNNRLDNANSSSFFIEDQFEINKFAFTAGMRYESINLNRNDWKGDISDNGSSWNDPQRTLEPSQKAKNINVVIPGLGFNYKINSDIEILAGIHKGFSPPGPGSNDSDDIKPEESINIESGLSYNSGFNKFKGIFFNNSYSNLLGDDTQFAGEGSYDQFNAGKVNIRGLELSLIRTFKINKFFVPINFNYTHTKSEFLTSFESNFEAWGSVKSGDELPYLPSNQFYAEIGLISKKGSAYLRLKNIGKMRTIAGSGSLDEQYSTDELNQVDFLGQYKINKQSNLFLSVKNLTGSKSIVSRRPAGLRPTMPRAIAFGFRFQF
ncbi:MAG: TonB-dependent receptor [Candidatus Neomarinimicrobiota bacterium]|nr:TonB-dependent receptor [Candidatus Neomarinimicrobiota bacterium]